MKTSGKFLVLAVVSAVSLLSAGCTTNPYTGESQASKAGQAAAFGAVAGAAIGYVSGSDSGQRRKRALIGAAGGAAIGGGVGHYMDRQEAELRQQLRGTGVSVTRNGNEIILNMPNSVTFATGSTDLRPGAQDALKSVALVMKEYHQTGALITGHTDTTGSRAVNERISRQRADAVGQYLIGQGISTRRLDQFGAAYDYPIASNATEAGRAQNRRVDITLVPLTE